MVNESVRVKANRGVIAREIIASTTPAALQLPLLDADAKLPATVLGAGSLRYKSETVLKSAFTDGGATVGTYVMTVTIPVGALLIRTKIAAAVAWSGDTSAVITVGDGSDVDRYMTGTPSIFAAAADGVECGVPSGIKLITTANTPTLTVTSTADFTNVNVLGSVTVTIYYIDTVGP